MDRPDIDAIREEYMPPAPYSIARDVHALCDYIEQLEADIRKRKEDGPYGEPT